MKTLLSALTAALVLGLAACGSTGTAVVPQTPAPPPESPQLTPEELAAPLEPVKQKSLVLFPFTGSNTADGEAIVSTLARQKVLRDTFNNIIPYTRNIIAARGFEQRFRDYSGLTDPDATFALAKELNADYVIAGFITRLADRNLVIVSILDVESLQQVAGDYRPYNTIEEIDGLIPAMAEKLAQAVTRDTRNLEGLSVPPFHSSADVNQDDATVLAQLLACDLANEGKYAVLPRTQSLDFVMAEHRRQRSGVNDEEQNAALGRGLNAVYVLSGSTQNLGNISKIAADIVDIETGALIEGDEVEYTTFSRGVELIPILASRLSGGPIITIISREIGGNFVFVEGGTFQMGSNSGEDNQKPIHRVTLDSFYMSKYEVTQKEWNAVMGSNPSNAKGDNLPVENVSWYDAVEYCNKRSIAEGLVPAYRDARDTISCDFSVNGYRLPTEAEWEYAAKGGNRDLMVFEYAGSNSPGSVAWYDENSYHQPHPVGTKAPNSVGIYDMSGNVYEWCWDWFWAYSGDMQDSPRGASSGMYRMMRGGGGYSFANQIRSAYRTWVPPDYNDSNSGFRVVRTRM